MLGVGALKLGAQPTSRNVSMKYPNSERLALDDVSFIINPGQTVLIVGESTVVTNTRSEADDIQVRTAAGRRPPSPFSLDCGTARAALFSSTTGPYRTIRCRL